jgi:leucyl aminopeptidase
MFQYSTARKKSAQFDLEIFFVFEIADKNKNKTESFFPPNLSDSMITSDFKGEFKDAQIVYQKINNKIRRILLIGLGNPDELNGDKLRETGFLIGQKTAKLKAKKILIHITSIKFDTNSTVETIADGFLYSSYSFREYKTKNQKDVSKPKITFLGTESISDNIFNRLEAIHSGIKLARNLANEPSNNLTPQILKKKASAAFRDVENINFKSLNKKELIEKKMNGILSVAKGSIEDPFLLIIRYKPEKNNGKKIVLVGKGVTFDSGGISIKPSAQMDEMKFDMSGAAAVIGILKTVSILKPDTEIIGIIPAVENMPGQNALKPGDIIKAYNGKTIEIINTDAEGRLILADALAFGVEKYQPNVVIDFATLTGAVVVALADKMAGMFTKSDEIAQILYEAGERSGDRVWRLPLLDSYAKEMDSKIADIKNLGSRWGGAVTAAKFLENFVSDSNWVHLDIAGVAYEVKDKDYFPTGATGFGVKLFINALDRLEQDL